jgi:hypothetical protein
MGNPLFKAQSGLVLEMFANAKNRNPTFHISFVAKVL